MAYPYRREIMSARENPASELAGGKAAASGRTPKLRSVCPQKLFSMPNTNACH
jgi:hypothetical protein